MLDDFKHDDKIKAQRQQIFGMLHYSEAIPVPFLRDTTRV